jgi:alkylhydroperoxidase family enzyme
MTVVDPRASNRPHFLADPPSTPESEAMLAGDLQDPGFVMNLTRLWSVDPSMLAMMRQLMGAASDLAGLGMREKGILVTAAASTLGDSYCSFAWGGKLAAEADAPTAASVLRGEDQGLTAAEHEMAQWARAVAADPSSTTADQVEALRAAGFTDQQIFAITVYVAMRLAFSTINGALGAPPDAELGERVPAVVQEAITWGRQVMR